MSATDDQSKADTLPPTGEVPPVPTRVNGADMAIALAKAWQDDLGTPPPSPEALAVILCQWALETGSGVAMIQYNVGNFKRPHPAEGERWTSFSTFEYVNQQRVELHPPDVGCRFAAFATLEEGCAYYLHALYTHWTKAWPSALAGDVGGFARGLSAQGYYTAPVTSYFRGMLGHWAPMLAAAQKALAPPAPPPEADPPAVLAPDVQADEPNTPDDPEEPV